MGLFQNISKGSPMESASQYSTLNGLLLQKGARSRPCIWTCVHLHLPAQLKAGQFRCNATGCHSDQQHTLSVPRRWQQSASGSQENGGLCPTFLAESSVLKWYNSGRDSIMKAALVVVQPARVKSHREPHHHSVSTTTSFKQCVLTRFGFNLVGKTQFVKTLCHSRWKTATKKCLNFKTLLI